MHLWTDLTILQNLYNKWSLATFVNSSASCLVKPKLACILLWELPTLLAESTACFPNSVSLSPMSLKTSEAFH